MSELHFFEPKKTKTRMNYARMRISSTNARNLNVIPEYVNCLTSELDMLIPVDHGSCLPCCPRGCDPNADQPPLPRYLWGNSHLPWPEMNLLPPATTFSTFIKGIRVHLSWKHCHHPHLLSLPRPLHP